MTAREMKIKTFSLIEELYPELAGLADDEDILKKINGVINSVMYELARLKKISAKYEYDVKEDTKTLVLNDIPSFYQLISISNIKYEILGNYEISFTLEDKNEEKATIYYYKYPEKMELEFSATEGKTEEEVSKEYDNNFEFELSEDVLEIMPYGIASDLLKNDMISAYGKYFDERYQALKNMIDTRKTSGKGYIDGGVDI